MFQLNYRDNRPFYEQIKDNVRQLVITHSIGENEKIPSVRELASALTINPNTIQRAYRDLEQEVECRLLKGAIKRLSRREQTIICLRFGINMPDGKEKTQKEVADILGISQSYISRLEKRIMKQLKKDIARYQ